MTDKNSALAPQTSLTLRDSRFVLMIAGLVVLLTLPLVFDDVFITSLVARMMIFAIAAASLDLILGYGGMVSFGHAAFLGVGSYAVGILAFYEINDGYLQFAAAIIGSALVAALIGALSLRTGGLYFIMITFAFSQMLYYLGISLEPYGGDDGMNTDRSDFGFMNLNDNLLGASDGSRDMQLIFFTTLAILVVSVIVLRRFVNSRFGMVVRGAQSNDPRMQTIGFPTFRYRLTAFVIAGAICGLAGALWANHQEFVTPEYMHWFRSGEIMVMVLMGGMGTIFGPVVGAITFLTVEELLKSFDLDFSFQIGERTVFLVYTGQNDWPLIFGPMLVLLVLFTRKGLLGMIPERSREFNAVMKAIGVFFVALAAGAGAWMVFGDAQKPAAGAEAGLFSTKFLVKYLLAAAAGAFYAVSAARWSFANRARIAGLGAGVLRVIVRRSAAAKTK
ncbi:MAG: branched-chain amino acid ABC transporter permease [Alphaproteobacteria bacterium]